MKHRPYLVRIDEPCAQVIWDVLHIEPVTNQVQNRLDLDPERGGRATLCLDPAQEGQRMGEQVSRDSELEVSLFKKRSTTCGEAPPSWCCRSADHSNLGQCQRP